MRSKQRNKVIVHHQENELFLLVGPACSGKTTLMLEMAETLKDRVEIIKSVTTRPERDDKKDHLQYDFITEEAFLARKDSGKFVECPPRHGGYLYAMERATLNTVLTRRHGICFVDEYGVLDLQAAKHQNGTKYRVMPVKIIPIGNKNIQRNFYALHPGREETDEERSKIDINYSFKIENRFIEGGFQEAVHNLAQFIRRFSLH